ncbi:Aste57867_14341 [Aphanomyces stellatus]|uniref:BK channel n=1 Tax=Aphanomyces stellatus TaxID=120398 RepID=A0A485L0F8_9STRA|nr:hypothetical protein As57867_014287 [Aphanomyces stellatus]VFT91165.1 Aste57867_14341 [Aphanomyces stellatus]
MKKVVTPTRRPTPVAARRSIESPKQQKQRNYSQVFISDRQKMARNSRLSMFVLGNDHWDLFQGIPKGFSLRTRVRIKLENSQLGYTWDLIQTTVSLVACAFCVVQSYHEAFVFPMLDVAFGLVFALDYCLRFYCAKNRLLFPFTFNALVDLLAIAPTVYDNILSHSLGTSTNRSPTFSFLRFVRVLRIMKAVQMTRHSTKRNITAVQQQLLSMFLLVLSIVFISACVFQLVENTYRDDSVDAGGKVIQATTVTLGDAFYFILVTMSTVGYGDIVPQTTVGKVVTAAMILLSLVMLPQEVNRLVSLLSMQSPFRRTYVPVPGLPHVLLLGQVANPSTLMEFFAEFYHADRIVCLAGHAPTTNNIPCVIMAPVEPSEELRALLVNPLLQNRVTYIKGSILNEEDMHRVAVDEAQAAFLFTDKNSSDFVAEDANTVLRSLVLENVNPELQVFMQVISPSYSDFITHNDSHHILCIDQHKLSLMAKNCLCPGLSTLVCNLFRSLMLPEMPTTVDWKREYVEGSTMEIYTAAMPTYLVDLSFTKAADVLYDIFDGEVILVGVHESDMASSRWPAESPKPHGNTATLLHALRSLSVRLGPESPSGNARGGGAASHIQSMHVNPGANYILRPHHTLYVLCESQTVAQLVSGPDHYNLWVRHGNAVERPLKQRYSQPYDLLQTNARLVSTRTTLTRKPADVFVDHVASANPTDEYTHAVIRNHIVVVSDLVDVPIETFIKPLRLAHYTEGSKHYRPILFVSTSKAALDAAFDVAKHYEGVFLMLIANDSKDTFFQAGIVQAKCCVLLAEKAGQRLMDGESLDSRVIFRYLTVQKILENYAHLMQRDFTVFVEIAASSTMKVMDTTLTKRLMAGLSPNLRIRPGITTITGHSSKAPRKSALTRPVAHINSFLESVSETHKAAWKRHKHVRAAKKKHTSDPYAAVLPFYAAGFGVPTDFFDSLLCQSFFTPELLGFARELLCMDQRPHTNESVVSSSITQVPLPDSFAGKTFGEFYSYLLTYESVIAIGLYRNSMSRVTLPYVYTAPKRTTVLRSDDFVFILAQPHTQIALENAMDFEADVVESRIQNMHITKSSIQHALHKIRQEKQAKEGEVLPQDDDERPASPGGNNQV